MVAGLFLAPTIKTRSYDFDYINNQTISVNNQLLPGFIKQGDYAVRTVKYNEFVNIGIEFLSRADLEYKLGDSNPYVNTYSRYLRLTTSSKHVTSHYMLNMFDINNDLFLNQSLPVKDNIYIRYNIYDAENNPDDNDYMSDWDELFLIPKNIKQDVKLDFSGGSYLLDFNILGSNPRNMLKVDKLPHHDLKDFNRLDADIASMVYYVDDNNHRNIYYDFYKSTDTPGIDSPDFKGFRPSVNFNIDTKDINAIEDASLYGVMNIEGDNVYIDVVFPMALDDLLEISMTYEHRNRYGALGVGMWWGAWTEKEVTRIKDAKEAKLKWYESLLKGTVDISHIGSIGGWIDLYQNDRGKAEHIRDINRLASPAYKNDYIKKINDYRKGLGNTPLDNTIFGDNNSLYRIYLDNHYRFGATKFQVRDVEVMSVKYVYKGKYYEDVEPPIEVPPEESDSDIDRLVKQLLDIWKWIINNKGTLVMIGIGIVALLLLAPIISIMTLLFRVVSFVIRTLFKLPGKIINAFKLLFVPKKKPPNNRNQRRRY